MGKGKRAHTISIPSINLTVPKSSSDHSYAPATNFIGSLSKSTSEQTTFVNNNTERWQPPRKPKMKYDDLEHKMEAAPLYVLVCTYLNYFVLILFGHLRDILGKLFKPQAYSHLTENQGYAPLVSDFDSFYTRRLYVRIR
jgi:serine palmitoyltransferase